MNIKPVFHPWKGAEIRECDLPAGVWYRAPSGVEFIAAEGGRCIIVRGVDGAPCCRLSLSDRGTTPVVILNWPEWCGPRPDAQPTLSQIRELAPHPNAQTVWLKDGRKKVEHPASYYEGSAKPSPSVPFLGWLTLEDER